MQGTTTVAFYNKVRTFTANDFYSGEVKKWMEQTYAWWYALSPCSTAQTTQTTTTTTTNTTSNTSSSSSSSSGSSGSDNSGSGSSDSGGSSDNSGDSGGSSDNSGDNGSDSDGGGSDDSGDNGSGDDGGDGDDGGSDDNNNEEKEQEEQEETEEQEEETEEQEEEQEEESEEEEEQEEESEEEESEEENKRNPILISANLMAMSGLDGTLSNVASFGFSQTALNGVDSYSANMMIWDNLKQFTLGGAKSHIFYNYDNAEDVIIRDGDNTYVLGQVYGRGTIHTIQSVSVSFMYMYGVMNITTGLSNVYIVQKNEKWKGLVGGYSISNNVLFGSGQYTVMPSFITFATKPYNIKRYTLSPMLAFAFNPIYFSSLDDKIGYNEHVVTVLGLNVDFNLTKNFRANIGGNVVKSTDNFPLTYSITIGAKFKLL
jgi:flagellar motor protein MotB